MTTERFVRLKQFEPDGRESCLCGSGKRFKDCCREFYRSILWPHRRFDPALPPKRRLQLSRAHLTWYRLCHIANTKPALAQCGLQAGELLEMDLAAMSDLSDELLHCYVACGIASEFPEALEALRDAIDDPRWHMKVDYQLCSCLFIYLSKRDAAQRIARRYDWRELTDASFLTLWMDLFSGQLSQVDVIDIGKRILSITTDPALRLQYSCVVGIQHCLLRDHDTGVGIIAEAINDCEPEDVAGDVFGKHLLAHAHRLLTDFTGDPAHLDNALELLQGLIEFPDFTPEGIANVWCEIGACELSRGQPDAAAEALRKSLAICVTPVATIFLAKSEIALGGFDSARQRLLDLKGHDLEEPHHFDLVIAQCKLAIRSRLRADVDDALAGLKELDTKDPLFEEIVRRLLVDLYEMKDSAIHPKQAEARSERMSAIVESLNRYVKLQPKLFGVGIDLNAVLEDLANRRRSQSNGE